MIDDLRRLGGGPDLEADICLIGGGAAGITLTHAFIDTPLRVCLVEGGGFDFEEETQRLYAGQSVGLPHYGMEVGRLRFLGGTTNHWGGRCTTLDALDFAPRRWIPDSGWPIERADLEPHYRRARDYCGLGVEKPAEEIFSVLRVGVPELNPKLLRAKLWQYAPYPWSFGVVYREALRHADNIAVLLHANVTEIVANGDRNAVEAVRVAALDGPSRRIRAKSYVLCCGAIENARLLLATEQTGTSALGNQYDVVGRYYMEHLRGPTGIVVTDERLPAIEDIFNYFTAADGTKYQTGLALTAAAQRERELLNCCAAVEYAGDPASGVTAGQTIWRELSRGHWADDIGEKVWRVLCDLDVVAANLHRRLAERRHPLMPLKAASIIIDMEQAPNPDSRVTLAAERNALGQREPRLDWRLTDLEHRTAEQFARLAAVEMTRLGLGRCRLADWLAEPNRDWAMNLSETYHQMGTTRMAASPRQGVVDENCGVHGVQNLYVAGSSVFPAGGHANPTLTIVAMALRLADHLRTTLG
jgi:choline dehydrogenase-like flavoprotein